MNPYFKHIGIVGAGAMGREIAQIAAQAGSTVLLFDTAPGAASAAIEAIHARWYAELHQAEITEEVTKQLSSRLEMAHSLNDLAKCTLIIEAVVERMDVKYALFQALETLVAPDAVLVSNTSSLSINALGTALRRRERFAGFHFLNPVPRMKVVEIIPDIQTAAAVVHALQHYANDVGHTAVMAKDTPGFVVHHAGQGFMTEAMQIAAEGVADFVAIDRILCDQVGFTRGPFELMDVTGLDVSLPVMESIYQRYYQDPRYRPNAIAAQRLAAGLTGLKAGEGFYTYTDGMAQRPPEVPVPVVTEMPPVWLSPRAARRVELLMLLKQLGAKIETGQSPSPIALTLVAPLGFDVTTVAVVERLDPARTVGIDMFLEDATTQRRVLATNPATRTDMRDAAHALFARDGKAVSVIRDSGGFVTQRVVTHIVNIASDMCQQGICSPKDLEQAVTLGLGYPQGPLALGNVCGPTNVLEVLFNMQTVYGDTRYRPSPWLRRRGAIGLSLLHEEE